MFLILTTALVPIKAEKGISFTNFLLITVIFITTVFICNKARSFFYKKIKYDTLESGETVIINQFIDKLRFCYTLDDFYTVIADILEKLGDCSVMLVDRSKNYILYNSPNRLTTSETTRTKLDQNYTDTWADGHYFFDRHIGVTSNYKKSRGFFLCYNNYHLYVFCKYTRLFDIEIYASLYEEYKRFVTRSKTITTLSEISATTKEWEQLAETQQSFLPQKIPNIPKLKIATYFRPLVNVSGDYF